MIIQTALVMKVVGMKTNKTDMALKHGQMEPNMTENMIWEKNTVREFLIGQMGQFIKVSSIIIM